MKCLFIYFCRASTRSKTSINFHHDEPSGVQTVTKHCHSATAEPGVSQQRRHLCQCKCRNERHKDSKLRCCIAQTCASSQRPRYKLIYLIVLTVSIHFQRNKNFFSRYMQSFLKSLIVHRAIWNFCNWCILKQNKVLESFKPFYLYKLIVTHYCSPEVINLVKILTF